MCVCGGVFGEEEPTPTGEDELVNESNLSINCSILVTFSTLGRREEIERKKTFEKAFSIYIFYSKQYIDPVGWSLV